MPTSDDNVSATGNRRDWPFEDDDDFDDEGKPVDNELPWPGDEPEWIGFLKALGVGLLLPLFFLCLIGLITAIVHVIHDHWGAN